MSSVETQQSTDVCCLDKTDICCSGKLWLAQCGRCTGISTRKGLTRGEESEEGGSVDYCARVLPQPPFLMFFGGLKINEKMVPKK